MNWITDDNGDELLAACRCALADLEGLIADDLVSEEHPARTTVVELRAVVAKAEGGGA